MISVIFPTRNRAQLLNEALGSLVEQEIPTRHFEVLVIDNGSNDETPRVSKQWSKQIANLRYFYAHEPGLHVGRHRGMKEARGDILVFADDDIEALPSWLASIADAFKEPSISMVGGNSLPMYLEHLPAWLQEFWNNRSHDGSRSLPWLSIQELPAGRYPISPYQIWGCNFAIRKKVLLAAKGFHPDAMPKELIRFRGDGETHVSRYVANNSLNCLFESGASVYHKVLPERMTFAYFHQRGFNQGVSDSYTQLRGEFTKEARTSKPGKALRTLLRRLTRWGNCQFRYSKPVEPLLAEAQTALDEFQAGHQEGFAYHQTAYHSDPEVRAWVHQECYFEE